MVFDDVEEVKGDKTTLTGWLYTDVRDHFCYLEDIDKYEIVSENANCVRLNRIKNSPLSFWVLLPLFTLNIDVYMLNKKYTTF